MMNKKQNKGPSIMATLPAQSSTHTRNRSVNLTSAGGQGPQTSQGTARYKVQTQVPVNQSGSKAQPHSRQNNANTTMPNQQRAYNSIGPGYHGGRNQKVTTTGGQTVQVRGGLQQSTSKNKNSMKVIMNDTNTSSGKNMKSVSLSKRLQMVSDAQQQQIFQNNTIDFNQQLVHGYADLNNTAIMQQQINQQIANRMVQDQMRNSQPKTTTNRRSKHAKAFSMVPNNFANEVSNSGLQIMQQVMYPGQTPFSGRTPITEHYLNQPLSVNQKNLNMTQLNTTQPIPQTSQLQTPIDYQQKVGGLESIGDGSAFNFAQLLSPKDHLIGNTQAAMHIGHTRWPTTNNGHLNQTELIALAAQPQGNSSYSFLQQPTPYTGAPLTNQFSSKGSGLNQTGRSYSHCSRRDIQITSSGKAINTTTYIKPPNIPEAQLIESEEHFESGKVFLGEKKYKEAIKMFSKSLTLNKMNYDALFYRAVSNLDSGQPTQAITDLNDLVEQCPDYRKTMFIVLSIAYRRVNDYTAAQRTLSKALMKYPRYIEAYIARGQIFIFEKKWEKALSDFRAVIQLQPMNGLGYLGQGDSLKGIGNYNGALTSFTKSIDVDQKTISQGLMKRGLLLLQMKLNEQALLDFTKLTEVAEESNQPSQALSKAYFYKAKALKKMNNLSDSILYFEQVIRAQDDNHLASSALYEIAKIKIQQKDFYEAYYNLKRANHFKLKQRKLVNYKMFTEGVIFLMKRKTKTGLKLISSLIERLKPTQNQQPESPPDYIYNLVFLYRAYGYFVIEDYESSLKDYIKGNQIKKLNISALFNMSLCQGLKSLNSSEYENAISFFTKASQKLPQNRDPFLLRAIAIVRYAMHKPIKLKSKTKMLKDAKRDLNKAMLNSPKDYQVLYLRGLINFALNFFYDAITDLETVIEKSEEANAKHYLARGRCYACLSMFKEAITDLSIAINLNKDLLDAYLNRGKCAYLIGDTGLAFMDFQKLIVIEPKNPMVHIYAGNLLMTTGSYEDATKAFTNADNIQKSSLALYQRGRCNVALNFMAEALKDLNKVIEQAQTDKVAIADRECLNALKIASGGSSIIQLEVPEAAPVLVDTDKDDQMNQQPTQIIFAHEKAVYQKAVAALAKLISQENNEHLSKIMHDSSILHLHSQMIPSAHRTKTDKIRAIRRRKEQERRMKDGKEKRNDLRFRVQQQEQDEQDEEFEDISELDAEELQKLNKQLEAGSNATQGADLSDDEADTKEAEEANYYKENIFNKEDYYLYRGILQIYAGDYDKALADLDQSSGIMHVNKVLYPKNQFPEDDEVNAKNDDKVSQASSQTDLSDVGLCSLNIHEFTFNKIVCYIMQKQFSKAIQKLDYMLSTVPKKYANQLWIIRGTLYQMTANQQQAKKDFKRASKYDKDNTVKFIETRQNIYLSVFPQQQRLCNSFAFLKTPLVNGNATIYIRPSFSFPFIKPPNMIPCVDNGVLDFFTAKAVPLKPEAPWIKKCSFGIKFTDEIYLTDDDRENTPDEDKEYKKRKQRQQEKAGMDSQNLPRSMSERVVLHNNIFADNEGEKELAEAAQLLEMFKKHYPDNQIDIEPGELGYEQLQQIKEALKLEEMKESRDAYIQNEAAKRSKEKPYNKMQDLKILKEQIQIATKKKPVANNGGRNVAAGNVKTQQNAGKKIQDEEEMDEDYADEKYSDEIEEDEDLNMDEQQDEIDLEEMDNEQQDNVTDSSDQRDFADIKKSLRK